MTRRKKERRRKKAGNHVVRGHPGETGGRADNGNGVADVATDSGSGDLRDDISPEPGPEDGLPPNEVAGNEVDPDWSAGIRKEMLEMHIDLLAKHFTLSTTLDKQLLWLAGAALGLPFAYIAQRGLANLHGIAPFFCWAVVLLMFSIAFSVRGLKYSISAYDILITQNINRYNALSAGRTYQQEGDRNAINARACSRAASWLFFWGGILLLFFFVSDILGKNIVFCFFARMLAVP